MITFKNISLRRGQKQVLNDASLNIYSGQKLGVIGRNGCGKTSLFLMLTGELANDAGDFVLPAGLRISHMEQETGAVDRTARDFVMDGDGHFRQLESALKLAEESDNQARMAELHGELELAGAYTIRNRAEQLLSGLGFAVEEFGKQVGEFSGGWRVRLNLARSLIQPSDLLLLDEPTNHLDLEASLWLMQWLQRYEGTLLLISHDRSFLDSVVGHIVSFENQALVVYPGDYSQYEKSRAERLARQQAEYEKQEQRKKEIEGFVRRFRAKATKARQAQSRLKALARMRDIAPAHVDSPFQFTFPEPGKIPDSLLACEHLDIGYEFPLISDFSLNLRGNSRIGLLGPNGLGKSTFLKTLVGQQALLGGEITCSEHLKTGYCAQHQVDALDINATPLQLMQRLDSKSREQEFRNFLGRFDFQGSMVEESIEHFSGGEKSRLALALVAWQKPNLLLLDEPTNHLDLEMCHALTVALQDYQGGIILISHDRHLLANTVDQFLLIKDGKLTHFDGDLDDYEKVIQKSRPTTSEQKNSSSAKPVDNGQKIDRKEARQQSAAQRERMKPLLNEIKKLERMLEDKGKRLAEIESKLASTEIYEDSCKEELSTLLKEQGRLESEIEGVEEDWMRCSEALESG